MKEHPLPGRWSPSGAQQVFREEARSATPHVGWIAFPPACLPRTSYAAATARRRRSSGSRNQLLPSVLILFLSLYKWQVGGRFLVAKRRRGSLAAIWLVAAVQPGGSQAKTDKLPGSSGVFLKRKRG